MSLSFMRISQAAGSVNIDNLHQAKNDFAGFSSDLLSGLSSTYFFGVNFASIGGHVNICVM